MNIKIIEDEWHPVYSIVDNDLYDYDIELTSEQIERIKKASIEFEACQTLVRDIIQ